MRQVWIKKAGAPEVLEVRETPTPAPAAGEVQVKVAAAGINFADIMARMGLYPDAPPIPCVVGYEVAGTIEAVGAGVDASVIGDRVVAVTRFSGYSSHLCIPAAQVVKLEDSVTLERAAAAPVNYLTAYYMLVVLGNVQAGQRVLVHAVAGGVGQAALQICKWRGAEVYGTASAGKHARLRELGVDHCIDYRTQDFEAEVQRLTRGEGVHLALDAVGGASFMKSYRCLRDFGALFMFGASSFAVGKKRSLLALLRGVVSMPRFGPARLMSDNKGVYGFNLGQLWHRSEELRDCLRLIMGLITDGTFEPRIDKTFSFDRAGDAHAYIQDRKNFGKILLTP